MKKVENKDIPEEVIQIVKDGNNISCDEITNDEYWNPEWTECPVCGAKPDSDGVWVHSDMQ